MAEQDIQQDIPPHLKPRRRRNYGRPFPKGKSGNPGGKPKTIPRIKDLATQYTEEAFLTLVDVMRGKKTPPATRAHCAEVIIERADGRTPITVSPETAQTAANVFMSYLVELQLERTALVDVTPSSQSVTLRDEPSD